MSPYIKTEEKKHYNLDKNSNQPFPNNPWGMFPNQPMNNYNQQPNPGHKPKQHPKQHPNQQPKQDNMPPFNPWNVLPGFRPNGPYDDNPSHNKKPDKYNNNPSHQPPPGYNPHQPEHPNNNLRWQEPDDYSPPRQEPEDMAPDNYPFNPWSVLPAFRPSLQERRDRLPKRIVDRKPPKKILNSPGEGPDSGPGRKDPSLKYIPAPVIKEYIGQVINTYIPGYGRVNVYVKGINRNGMVHLVILDPKPSDYIYVHNSDLVGIYPPTL